MTCSQSCFHSSFNLFCNLTTTKEHTFKKRICKRQLEWKKKILFFQANGIGITWKNHCQFYELYCQPLKKMLCYSNSFCYTGKSDEISVETQRSTSIQDTCGQKMVERVWKWFRGYCLHTPHISAQITTQCSPPPSLNTKIFLKQDVNTTSAAELRDLYNRCPWAQRLFRRITVILNVGFTFDLSPIHLFVPKQLCWESGAGLH